MIKTHLLQISLKIASLFYVAKTSMQVRSSDIVTDT